MLVIPGTRLGHKSELVAGEGTYEREDYIYSSIVGSDLRIEEPAGQSARTIVQIVPGRAAKSSSSLPKVGSTIIGRVVKMNYQFVSVDIMVVDGRQLRDALSATLRKQDVRTFERDSVDLSLCFCPGDVVRAEVISLGDSQSYYLSTAKNELGVLYAETIDGDALVPVAWDNMQCSRTGAIEPRKCAKP